MNHIFLGPCDDGNFCNGVETRVAGECQLGTPVNCDDGVSCTDDSCNESLDSCDNIANDANCDDGQFCNGSETCNAVNDCQPGAAPDCDDGVGCTDDSCNESLDSCDNIANDAHCDDGIFCNGAEMCTGDGCQGTNDAYPLGRWDGICMLTPSGTCTAAVFYTTPTSGTWQSSTGPGEFTQTGSMVPGGLLVRTLTAAFGYVSIHQVTVSDDGFCMSGTWSDNQGNSGTFEHCWLDGVLPCPAGTCDEQTDSCVTPIP